MRSQDGLILPPPGKPGHYEDSQGLARRLCVECSTPIGYGERFWFVDLIGPDVVHEGCRRLAERLARIDRPHKPAAPRRAR